MKTIMAALLLGAALTGCSDNSSVAVPAPAPQGSSISFDEYVKMLNQPPPKCQPKDLQQLMMGCG